MLAEEWAAILAAEADRGSELRTPGAILHIWRIPGRRVNVSGSGGPQTRPSCTSC